MWRLMRSAWLERTCIACCVSSNVSVLGLCCPAYFLYPRIYNLIVRGHVFFGWLFYYWVEYIVKGKSFLHGIAEKPDATGPIKPIDLDTDEPLIE